MSWVKSLRKGGDPGEDFPRVPGRPEGVLKSLRGNGPAASLTLWSLEKNEAANSGGRREGSVPGLHTMQALLQTRPASAQ